MHDLFVLLILVVIVALIFDYINGFHDTANSIATVVSTKVLRPHQAVTMAAVLNLVGAFIGVEVAKTIGKGIVETGAVTQLTVLGALLGAIIWNLITWYYGIPSSSSHALIGGLCGSTAAFGGFSVINTAGLTGKVFLPMIISPILGITLGFIVMLSLYWMLAKARPGYVSKIFAKLQLVSAGFMALSHGSNDAQKTMGIITMALISYTVFSVSHVGDFAKTENIQIASRELRLEEAQRNKKLISEFISDGGFIINENSEYRAYKITDERVPEEASLATEESGKYVLDPVTQLDSATVRDLVVSLTGKELANGAEYKVTFNVPTWVVVACAVAMGLGTMAGGWRIIHTMGSKMIKLQPVHGFAAETSAAVMILGASFMGMPVSTTHIISTSIMGVGASKRFSAVKWGIVKNIVGAWILTFPVSFLLGGVCFFILNLFFESY